MKDQALRYPPMVIDIPPDILSNGLQISDRDEQIAYLHLFKDIPQAEIASKYSMTRQNVSRIVCQFLDDDKYTKRLARHWEKETSLTARKKALKVINSVDPDKLHGSSKAYTAGVLIDKARLIDGDDDGKAAGIQINIINYGERDAKVEISP